MNTSKYIILLCFLLASYLLSAQTEEGKISEDVSIFNVKENQVDAPLAATSFWRPFTIEFNSNGFFHGISLEKQIHKKLFVRASFSSDFEVKSKYVTIQTFSPSESFLTYSPLGNKLSLGVLYNLINIDCINTSLRTGVQLGIRQKPEEEFYGARISNLFVEVPLLLQYRFLENYSIDLGVKVFSERLIWPGSSISNGFYREFTIPTNGHQLHLGLRYTFAEKQ